MTLDPISILPACMMVFAVMSVWPFNRENLDKAVKDIERAQAARLGLVICSALFLLLSLAREMQ